MGSGVVIPRSSSWIYVFPMSSWVTFPLFHLFQYISLVQLWLFSDAIRVLEGYGSLLDVSFFFFYKAMKYREVCRLLTPKTKNLIGMKIIGKVQQIIITILALRLLLLLLPETTRQLTLVLTLLYYSGLAYNQITILKI